MNEYFIKWPRTQIHVAIVDLKMLGRNKTPNVPWEQFLKQIFAPTEKLAPTGKVGALAMLGSAQFAPMQWVCA
jgi:hypothetical protein